MKFIDRSQYPFNRTQLVKIVAQSKENSLRVKYTGGTFPVNTDNAEVIISLNSMKRLLTYDPVKHTITVEPGITLKELVSRMKYLDYTLALCGTLPNMSVADAINVGLMGSNGTISQCLQSCEVVLPDSSVNEWTWPLLQQIPELNKHIIKDENFYPSLQTLVCGLGTVGVIAKCTLHCEPNKYAQEMIYDVTMEQFIGNVNRLTESMYVNASWFPLFDKVLVTNSTLVRLRLAEFQPPWKYYLEYFCWGMNWIVRSVSPCLAWYFTGHAGFLSYTQFALMSLASSLHTTYCYPPQTFVSVRKYCRGIKWAFALQKLEIVVKSMEKWSKSWPHLCSTPVSISLQTHEGFDFRRPFLCPYSNEQTFTIWTDWFSSASIDTEFSAPMAELEAILQTCGGRKCWSAGPIYASSLIGKMYPGYKHWCETRTILDPKSMFRSAYMEGDVIGEKY